MKTLFCIHYISLILTGVPMETQHIHWYGQSAFRIEDGGKQIYLDPFKLPEDLPKADVIFISHAHFDHFSPEDIARIRKEGTIIVAPKDVASKLTGQVVAVVPGQQYTVGTIKVQTVPAYNLDKKFHPKENKWVGYIITLSNGQRIYHAGDTDSIPEMRTVHADIALLPCGGTYTMTARQAADAANLFKPKMVIPMHWGGIVGAKADAEEVKKLFKGDTEIKTKEEE
jgi:L-ascorbate metabolism protein UlaG (beta-lactamase superfamily)